MADEQNTVLLNIAKAQNQYNLMQIRLDPTQLIEQIRLFLNAEIESFTQSEDGTLRREFISVGSPKANKKGIASILSWIQMTINPSVVQGNFPMDERGKSSAYDRYIYDFQINLGHHLMVNLYEFGIDEDEFEGIIDSIMNMIQPFMSRCIGNKERASYSESLQEMRVERIQDSRKIPGLTK